MHYYRVHTFVKLNALQHKYLVKIFALMYYLYYEYFTIHQEGVLKTSQPHLVTILPTIFESKLLCKN